MTVFLVRKNTKLELLNEVSSKPAFVEEKKRSNERSGINGLGIDIYSSYLPLLGVDLLYMAKK